jgi:hypothetical protein
MEQPLCYGQRLPRAEDTHSIMEDFFNFSPATRIVEFATMMNTLSPNFMVWKCMKLPICTRNYLVGGWTPLKNIGQFVHLIPNIWKNNPNVPITNQMTIDVWCVQIYTYTTRYIIIPLVTRCFPPASSRQGGAPATCENSTRHEAQTYSNESNRSRKKTCWTACM